MKKLLPVSGRRSPVGARTRIQRYCSAFAVLLAATVAPGPALCAPFPSWGSESVKAPVGIPAPSIVQAKPALWEVRDSDTTIYLFGTFHTLDARTVWFDRRVRRAFDVSGELVLETVVPANPEEMNAAREQVLETSRSGGPPRLKPFIEQTQTVVSHGRAIGLSVEHGADAVLRRVAEDVGKPVGGLERFEDQLGALARIPTSGPGSAAPPTPPVTVTLNELLSAWTVGDTGVFSVMLQGFEAKSPDAYRMLISDRNARWGQWIANRLDQPGTVFLAVGSGHLAGKDSVQQWLAARGIEATRVA